jgi:transcriptional regulator with PAS, ATPase and Fis domain
MDSEKSRAEKIIEHDPNGLIVIDRNLNIVQFNKAFLHIFDIDGTGKIVGKNVNEVLGQIFFPSADITSEHSTIKQHKKTGKIVQLITFKLHDQDNLSACFCVDTTSHFHDKQRLADLKKQTLEKAHDVINRQMRVAQEIASLLGETTAESKTTLLQLIEILKEEDEIHD